MKIPPGLGRRVGRRFVSAPERSIQRQRGVVLIVALVILVLMTMIGMTAMRDTGLQERMAGNLRDRNLAFQSAEAALRAGETWLLNNATTQNPAARIDEPADWNGNSSPTPTGTIALNTVAANPSFHAGLPRHIEPLGAPCDGTNPSCGWCIYPITTYGVGGSSDAVVILQAQYQLSGVECRTE